jgi:archaellum component FlaF (FlaF/FlaG flagellin family)
MSFSNQNTSIQYSADGIQNRFAINFHILEGENELVAIVYDTDLNEVVSPYSIDHTNYPASEVVFVDPPLQDYIVLIKRQTNLTQATSFMKGAFPAEAVEESFDRAVMIAQENAAEISRAVINPIVGPTYEERVSASESAIVSLEAATVALDQEVQDLAEEFEDFDLNGIETQVQQNTLAIDELDASLLSLDQEVQDLANELQNIDLSVIESQVQQNASDIANINVALAVAIADIELAEISITNLSTDVSTIQTELNQKQDIETLVIVSAIDITINAVVNQIYIVKTDDVTIALPEPTMGSKLTVKMDNLRANCIISSDAGIDGFGSNYQLQSSYEAVKLVADGNQWFII